MKKRLLGTIITCDARKERYDQLISNINDLSLPFEIKTFKNPYFLDNDNNYKKRLYNSWLNSNTAYAWLYDNLDPNGWALFLEDDQIIYPAFKERYAYLMNFGEQYNIAAWFLSNRKLGKIEKTKQYSCLDMTLNRVIGQVPGTHGLLFRAKFLPALLNHTVIEPDDWKFFKVIKPVKYNIFQVVDPVLMQHNGIIPTYHTYAMDQHLDTAQILSRPCYPADIFLNQINKCEAVIKL